MKSCVDELHLAQSYNICICEMQQSRVWNLFWWITNDLHLIDAIKYYKFAF